MKDNLSITEQEMASAQGWGLCTVFDTRGYFAEAIVPVGERHDTPYKARTFVWNAAKNGDPVCQRALSIVAASEVAARPMKRKKK